MKRIWTGCLLALLIPYVATLAWAGTIKGEEKKTETFSGKTVILDRNSKSRMDVEEYLIGVVGRQIPADYGAEALKAQAIVARTYIYKQMGEDNQIEESALDMDYLEEKQLEQLWGSEKFITYYKNIQEAVEATQKTVLTCEGQLIDPLFHRASAGMTRMGDEHHPYLQPVESSRDVEAEEYLTMLSWEPEVFAKKISEIPDGGQVLPEQIEETMQMIEKDAAGYVSQFQIGSHTYTGEEIQMTLGLSSPCFTLEIHEGNIRSVSKGIGHGFGLSQYGAKTMADEGKTTEEILTYYYKNIVLISE